MKIRSGTFPFQSKVKPKIDQNIILDHLHWIFDIQSILFYCLNQYRNIETLYRAGEIMTQLVNGIYKSIPWAIFVKWKGGVIFSNEAFTFDNTVYASTFYHCQKWREIARKCIFWKFLHDWATYIYAECALNNSLLCVSE